MAKFRLGVLGNMGLWVKIILLLIGIAVAFPVYATIAGFFAGGLIGILASIVTLAFIGIVLAITLVIPYVRMASLGWLLGTILIHFWLRGYFSSLGV